LNFGIEWNFTEGSEDYEDSANIREQWTGRLFKNKPPVSFGFEYQSFGYHGITLLSETEKEIWISCDNRH
jgi:hypothetical protein